MPDINDCKSPDDVLKFALDNPTELLELLAADSDTAHRDPAFATFKDGTPDALAGRDRGHSIWEPIFADLDRRYPSSKDKALWKRNRWPFYFERIRNSVSLGAPGFSCEIRGPLACGRRAASGTCP